MSISEARAIMEKLVPPLSPDKAAWYLAVLDRWASAEPEAATAWLRRWSANEKPAPEWVSAVLTPLAAKDLRSALTASRFFGWRWTSSASWLQAAATKDPAGTMAFAEKYSQFSREAGPAFRVWLQRDSAAACKWLIDGTFRNSSAMQDIIADIAFMAPDRLAAVLAALPEGSDAREAALTSLAACEVDRDPAAALTKFTSLSEKERLRMLQPLAEQLAARGKPAEIVSFLAGLKENERHYALNQLRDQISYAGPERMLSLLRMPGLTEAESGNLFENAYALGPQYAAEFMAGIKHGGSSSANSILNFWAGNLARQPEETMTALRSMVSGGEVDRSSLMALTHLLNKSGSEVLGRMIEALPETHRAGPQAVLALHGALTNPEADLSAFTGLPDTAARREALNSVFSTQDSFWESGQRTALLVNLPPEQRLEAVQTVPLREEDFSALAPSVAEALRSRSASAENMKAAVDSLSKTMTDPSTALQWLDSLPEGPARDSARPGVFGRLAYKDPESASAWLNSQPVTIEGRDSMVEMLVRSIVGSNPEGATEWASSIRNDDKRRSVLELIRIQSERTATAPR
jgi:hypothetical protein